MKKKRETVVDKARRFAALQDEREKLVKQWEQLGMEIQTIDEDLEQMERR